MAGAASVLDQTFKITDMAGVLQYRAVVQGTNAGECKKPSAANEGGFLGVTQEAQANQYKGVAVRRLGVTRVTAAGVIAVGDHVRIADNTGKVESAQADVIAVPTTPKVNYPIGRAESASAADGDEILMMIAPFVVKTATS